jgi:hypothetical protein
MSTSWRPLRAALRLRIAAGGEMPVGDVTTLANPEVVEQIRVMVQGAGPVELTTQVAEDIKKFGQE